MHAVDFIQDLAVIMLVAGVVTILFHRLRQPVVLGYIVAGFIIGPHTPPFGLIHDEDTIKTLAELGVIFLMFCLGLEFSLRKLFQVGATAFIAAFREIVLMIWIGFEIGRFFEWSTMDSLFLGAILAISSTTIIVKALGDLKMKNERFAQLIFGVLIVEDILGIGIIALLSGIAVSGSVETGEVFSTVGKLSLFMIVALVVGILLVPRLLAYVAKFESNEMLLVTVLGLCFGFCLLVVKLEYSMVLGAFLIGAIMAESRQLVQIERLIEPVRDMFSAIFFVAIGLLIDPKILVEYAWPIALITVAVVLGKMFSCGMGAFIAGNDGPHLAAGRHGPVADRRVLLHHRRPGHDSESHQRLPLPGGGSGLGHHHPAHPVPDPRRRPALAAPGQRHAAAHGEDLRPLRRLAAQHPAAGRPCGAGGDDPAHLAAGRGEPGAGDRDLPRRRLFRRYAFRLDEPVGRLRRATQGIDLGRRAAGLAGLPDRRVPQAQGPVDAAGRTRGQAGESRTPYGAGTSGDLEIIPLLSLAGMMVLLAALSSSILPPGELLVVVVLVAGLVIAVLWRWLIRVHSRMQIALMETLDQEKGSH